MKNIERKKFKRLGINYLYLIIFLSHIFLIFLMGFRKSFIKEEYPLFILIDNYLVIGIIFNPIIISSIVKRTVEIEEKNNMWQLQLSFGEKISKILLDKFKILSVRLFLMQIIEWIIIMAIANRSLNFFIDREVLIRILNLFFSQLFINQVFIILFMVLEMKLAKTYITSFVSIVGAFTGIISMLSSKILCFINPFAFSASLINLSFQKSSDKFIRILEPQQYITLIISFVVMIFGMVLIKNMKNFKLNKN